MTKTRKYFWRVFLLLLVLIAIACFVIALNLGRIIKSGVLIYGPRLTQVSVNVDDVQIGLVTASAEIKNLVVGNPAGYKTPQAFSVGDVSVAVNPLTVLSDKIVVRSINIESPQITFEGGLDGNNLDTILANVDSQGQNKGTVAMGANAVSKAPTGQPTVASQPNPSRKLEVDDLVITGAKVNGSLELFGKEVALKDISIPDIHLTNLGTGPDGITPADLTSKVLHALTTATLTAVTSEATHLGTTVKDLGDKGAGSVKKTFNSLFGK